MCIVYCLSYTFVFVSPSTMTDSRQENQHNNNNNISHTNTHTGNTDIDVHMLDHQPASIIHTEAHTDANSHTDDEQQWIVQLCDLM